MYEIILGRNESDRKKLGLTGTIFLGKHYVTMEREKSLANPVYLDVNGPHVVLVSGKRGCLPGDHKVFTDSGYKEIKDFDEQKDKLLSFNKNELEFIWKNAKLLQYDIENEELTKLTLEDGRKITITDEHPLLVFHKNAVLVWRKGKDLEEDDLLVTTTMLPEVKNDKESARIARLLGFALADGNIYIQKGRWKDGRGNWYNGTKKRLRIDTDCEFVCNQAKEDIEEEFGVKARFEKRTDCNCWRTSSRHSKVVDKIMKLGVPAGKKSGIIRVPQIVWESSNEFKANFINALFSCDGHVQNDGMRVEYYSNSKKFMNDLQLLLAHFSIEAKIRKKKRSDRTDYISYRLVFSDYTSLINFRNKIGSFNKKKHERLQLKRFHLRRRRTCVKYIGDDLVCAKITRLEKVNGINKVYDLQVPETHSFIANGIISHNSGKSYSLGVIAEGIANLPKAISKNLTCFIFDTMGIYWTMKYPNYRDDKLLQEWSLKPSSLSPKIYVPAGLFEDYQKKNIPIDKPFAIKPSEMDVEEWCEIFQIELLSPEGLLFDAVLEEVRKDNMAISDILDKLKDHIDEGQKEVEVLINRLKAVQRWGIFSEKATPFEELIKGGQTVVLDLSAYGQKEGGDLIKALVIGFIAKKTLQSRILARKAEEVKLIQESGFEDKTSIAAEEAPLLWILIDEAHEFLPKEGRTLATHPLIQLLREGRQPGISLVLATQQPGKIHTDVLTQSDIVLSHRLTAKLDVEALNAIMQSYLAMDIQRYIDGLPRVKGAAIALDDANEKIYPLRVRPRFSWHGGEDPKAVREKVEEVKILGLSASE